MKNKLQQNYTDLLLKIKKSQNNDDLKLILLFIIKELYKGLKFVLKAFIVAFILLVTIFNMDIQHQQIKHDNKGNESMVLTDTYALVEVFTPIEAVINYVYER